MKNTYVGMGCFYHANPYGLVKTIADALILNREML